MSYQISVTDKALVLSLELEKVSFEIEGHTIEMHKLPHPVAFTCKPMNLDEVGGGSLSTAYVFKRIHMDSMGYDYFVNGFCRSTPWLTGQAISLPLKKARACIMVVSQCRPVLLVDTQGYDYARYVARVG